MGRSGGRWARLEGGGAKRGVLWRLVGLGVLLNMSYVNFSLCSSGNPPFSNMYFISSLEDVHAVQHGKMNVLNVLVTDSSPRRGGKTQLYSSFQR